MIYETKYCNDATKNVPIQYIYIYIYTLALTILVRSSMFCGISNG